MFAIRSEFKRANRTGARVCRLLVLAAACGLLVAPAAAHVDSLALTDQCGSCHVGHGRSGEPMLARSEQDFCFQCHGSESERSRMVQEGRLVSSNRLVDLRPDFEKMYSHPISLDGVHSPVEKLPSYEGGNTAHAECVDCHNPHQRVNGVRGLNYDVSGYSLEKQYLDRSVYEYEICLKCHSDHLGGKRAGQGVSKAFARGVRSQHPVTVAASGRALPSMRNKAWTGGRMLCSDCHRSEDPDGPRGPHGSNYEFLLSGNYNHEVHVQESPFEFEFCYSCHDRSSILADEGFQGHRLHIEGDPLTGRLGTSCFSCHASHGSPDNPGLISFNPQAVGAEKSGLGVQYFPLGDGKGTCVLMCHGHNHSPGSSW